MITATSQINPSRPNSINHTNQLSLSIPSTNFSGLKTICLYIADSHPEAHFSFPRPQFYIFRPKTPFLIQHFLTHWWFQILSVLGRGRWSGRGVGSDPKMSSIGWEEESFPLYADFVVLPFFAFLFLSVRFLLDRFVFEVLPLWRTLCCAIWVVVFFGSKDGVFLGSF